ncbi:MAG: S-layer homology domain-containing protein, partial [Bacillus sp. (in: firmicutes)]
MAFQSNKFYAFIAASATAVLVSTAVAPTASAANFKDVPDSSRYKAATDFLFTKGVKGFADGTFGVNANITRADAAVMLVNVLGLDIESAPSAGFTDVNERIEKHINALYAAEITKGAGNNKFNSYAQITRGELAIWLQKAFNLTAKEMKTPFADVGNRYTEAVAALVENKIAQGKNSTSFGTTAPATRGEYALFLGRAFSAEVQISLEAAIKEAEQAIGTLPSAEDLTEEQWSILDDVYNKLEKVVNLGGSEEAIKNIDIFYDLLYAISFEDELPEVTDVMVDLDSGEITLTFSNTELFKEYSVSVSAFVEETVARGTVAEELTGESSNELVITFNSGDLTETSTIHVDVSFMEDEMGILFMYVISAENGVWNIGYF